MKSSCTFPLRSNKRYDSTALRGANSVALKITRSRIASSTNHFISGICAREKTHSAAAIQSDSEYGQLQAHTLVAIPCQHAPHLFVRLFSRRILRSLGDGGTAIYRQVELRRQSFHDGGRRGSCQV